MKRKRKTTRLILFGIFCFLLLLLSIPFLAILVNLYCQTFGLPLPVKEKILSSLKEEGILIELDGIKAGIFTGVRLQNAIIKDNELSNWNLLYARKILVEFDINRFLQGEFKITEIKVEGGMLSIPLTATESENRPNLRIENISCHIENMGDQFKIIAFSGLLEGVNLTLKGTIIKPTQKEKDNVEFSLTVKPLLHHITPKIIDHFNSMDNFFQSLGGTTEAKISLDLYVPVENITESTISADVFLSEVIFRGMNLKTLAFNGKFSTQTIEISDFRLEFDDSEYLRGNFKVEMPTNEISSRLSFYGYPYKILKAIAPHLLINKQIPLPKFEGLPMSATIRIYPSPLSKINQWNVDTKLTASDIRWGNLLILELDGKCKYRESRIDFNSVKARLAPNIDVLVNGQHSIKEKQLLIKAEIIGDPNFTSEFINDKKVREIYKKVWKDFSWESSDRPHFYVDLYLDMITRPSKLLIQARSKMSNFIYKGIKIDEATGQFFLGFPESIFIFDNLEVTIDDRKGIAKLVWYGKPIEMEFELKSNITPPSVLALFNRKWLNFFENKGLVFNEPPYLYTQGRFSRRNPPEFELNVELDGTNLNYQSALINNFEGSIRIVDKLTTIKTEIGDMTYENWILEDAQAELEIGKENTAISGNAAYVKGLGIMLSDTDFNADCENGRIYTNSNTQTITFGEWQLNKVEGNSVYEFQELKSNATIETATFRNIKFDSITTDVLFKDEGLKADLDIEKANIYDEVEIAGIEGNLSIANNRAEMNGVIFELLHRPTNSVSHNLKTTCSYSESSFDIKINTDYFNCFNYGKLNRIKANISIDAGLLYGDYDIGELFWKDKIKVQNLTGNFDGYNAPWSFRSRCDEISFPFCKLFNVSSTGSFSKSRIKTSVSSEECQINRYTIKNVTAAVTNEKDNLSINRITGNIYGGRTTGELFYNEARKKGRVWLTAVDVDFEELINAVQSDSKRQMGGKLSGKVDLNFSNEPNEVEVTGNGKVFLEKGNLWKVPLLSDFLLALGKMKIFKLVVPQEEVGAISELSSDIEFQENKVYFQNMKTNGNIVLITADGYYGWSTKELDFRVKAKPLNPIFRNFLPEAIDPFSILLERRLTGKLNDPKWEEVSAIRDLFRTKEEKFIEPSL